MSPGEVSDAQLVARCRAGDQAAWSDLVQRFAGYVYAIVGRGFRLREHDCEDAFQEVFARLYTNLDNLKDDSAVRPWIAQTARRVAIDRLRASAREGPSIGDEFAEPPDPTDLISRLDEAMSIRDAVNALAAHCQEIITRFFIRDESYRTIGEALDIPPGTIASRISRCLNSLRETLSL